MLHLILLAIAILELTGRITGRMGLEYFFKPLIMIWMGSYFLLYRQKKELTFPLLAAFVFSWTGDILLMFDAASERFFYAGVGGFFLAQLAYIHIFVRYSENGGKGYLQRNPLPGLLFIGYASGFCYLLYPGLEGPMKPIILIYALSLITMSMTALNRHARVNHRSFLLVFIGSILFVLSDSMIAFNRFLVEFRMAGFWIMVTYITAQYLIMRGLLLERSAVRT